MRIQVVTTFSKQGYECYGRRFVDSFLEHEKGVPLACYHESFESIDRIAPNLSWCNLDHDLDRAKFLRDHGSDPVKVSNWRFPNHQSIRFCHKVFAVTRAAMLQDNGGWLVWMDADVEITQKPLWHEVLMPGDSLCFLGRSWLYTECGFVAYNLDDPKVRAMLSDMRRYYTSGEIFTRPQKDRHDSRCFDICRERSEVPQERCHRLAPPTKLTHVWPLSPLAKWSTHQKGPKRKMMTYGKVAP